MSNVIIKFSGGYRFLSNFWVCDVEFDGDTYPSSEHAFQAAKAINKADREPIKNAASASAAKRLGRRLVLRVDWESVKDSIMLEVLRSKYSLNKDLGDRLLDTNDAILIEGNEWHDNYFGVCYCDNCSGTGKNKLGEILMKVRNELKAEKEADNLEAELNFLNTNLHKFAVPPSWTADNRRTSPIDPVNRTHEECCDCEHEKTMPPPCKGHCDGPRHCDDFKKKDKSNDIELETL